MQSFSIIYYFYDLSLNKINSLLLLIIIIL